MEFKSLGALALHLAAQEVAFLASLNAGLEKCAKKVEQTAKDEIGHYQAAVGPYFEWAPLADATEAAKSLAGYRADAPLEASGEMRDSIEHKTMWLEAIIGSKDPKLFYHEFGTKNMPARAVMGPAVFRNKEYIRRVIGAATISGLFKGSAIHASLGYDDKL